VNPDELYCVQVAAVNTDVRSSRIKTRAGWATATTRLAVIMENTALSRLARNK
jgi:hypothetical protein